MKISFPYTYTFYSLWRGRSYFSELLRNVQEWRMGYFVNKCRLKRCVFKEECFILVFRLVSALPASFNNTTCFVSTSNFHFLAPDSWYIQMISWLQLRKLSIWESVISIHIMCSIPFPQGCQLRPQHRPCNHIDRNDDSYHVTKQWMNHRSVQPPSPFPPSTTWWAPHWSQLVAAQVTFVFSRQPWKVGCKQLASSLSAGLFLCTWSWSSRRSNWFVVICPDF